MSAAHKKPDRPPASTGLLTDVPISTCRIAADVRDDLRAIATVENMTLEEYLDTLLRQFIRSYQAPPKMKLQSLKRS